MNNRQEKNNQADEIIHDEIMKEGERLGKAMGPVTFEEAPDFDVHAEFAQLKRDRERQERAEEQEREAAKRQKISSWRRIPKAAKIVAACLALVVGVFACSMTSEANRMWWQESVERIFGKEAGTVVDNDENRVQTELPEQEAAAKIEEETGIQVPKFLYVPNDWEFNSYTIDTDNYLKRSFMYYKVGNYMITLYMHSSGNDDTTEAKNDGDTARKEEIDTSYATVSLMETEAESDGIPSVSAEWTYENVLYSVWGKLKWEEMKEMIGGMYY